MEKSSLLSALVLALVLGVTDVQAQSNVLLIVADDLGTEYVGAYSNTIGFTPNIDDLAEGGLRFDNCWAAAICSPSRASLHTGKYPFRTGVRRVVSDATPCSYAGAAAMANTVLQECETTLPELLTQQRPNLQHTLIGKWHLDQSACVTSQGKWGPGAHGWQSFYGFLGGKVDHYNDWELYEQTTSMSAPMFKGVQHEYATTAFVDQAKDWILDQHGQDKPWFCFLSLNAPHDPFHCPPEPLTPTLTCATSTCGTNRTVEYRAMVESMDTEIGRLVAALEKASALDNTYVIFTSDNGTPNGAEIYPYYTCPGCGHAKGTPYEGGVHVPLIIRGPFDRKGSTSALVHLVDLFPTIAAACGAVWEADAIDGMPLQPLLFGTGTTHHSMLFSDIGYFELGLPAGGPSCESACRRLLGGGHNGFCVARGNRYKLIRYIPTLPVQPCLPVGIGGAGPLELFIDLLGNPTEIGSGPVFPAYTQLGMFLNKHCPPKKMFMPCQ